MEGNGNNSLKNLFDSLNNFLVVLPPDPDAGILSAAVSLHLCLKNNNKNSQIGYSGTLPDVSNIHGHEELKESIGNQNLHINFDYLESNINKVDYEVGGDGKFSIIVQPKPGSNAPDINKIRYSYSGANADLVITFAISSLEELGQIYAQEKRFLDNSKILNITNSTNSQNFTPNLVQDPGLSYAEIITNLLKKVDLRLNSEIANNLLNSLYSSTNNLTDDKVNPNTFETVAFLLRQGATLPNRPSISQTNFSFPQPPFFPKPLSTQDQAESNKTAPVPSEWHSPKIYRSGA